MTKYRLTHDLALGGFDAKTDGAHLKEQSGHAIIAVTMTNGHKRGFDTAMKKLFGTPAPEANRMVIAGKTRLLLCPGSSLCGGKNRPQTLKPN